MQELLIISIENFKPLLGIGLSLGFVILGIYLVAVKAEHPGTMSPLLFQIVGAVCIAFFGGMLVMALRKVTKK